MRKFAGPPGLVRCVCVAAVLALSVSAAQADPVTVTGSISLNVLEGPSFDLAGPGFSASVFFNPFNNGFDLVPDFFDWCGRVGNHCLPGDSLKMGGSTEGDAFIGTGTVTAQGTTFNGADIFLDGEFVASNVIVPARAVVRRPHDAVHVQRHFARDQWRGRDPSPGTRRIGNRVREALPGVAGQWLRRREQRHRLQLRAGGGRDSRADVAGTPRDWHRRSCRPPAAAPHAPGGLSIDNTQGGPSMYPSSQRSKSLAFTMLFSCGLATAVRAEPIRVTGGYIQVGVAVTDFLIETTSGPIGGEQEGVNFPPINSGFSGEVVSLSRTYVGDLGHFTIGRSRPTGTRQLRVRRGRRDPAVR